MAEFHFSEISIDGIACAVPQTEVRSTDFYARFGKQNVDNFVGMTGIASTFRSSDEQTASDLCFVAARDLLKSRGLVGADIGALVFVSQTPDYRLPATACVLHHRLGCGKSCAALDLNLGCSGFVYGFALLASMMSCGRIAHGLLLAGDTCYKTDSPDDRSTFMMFGDAGSATLLSLSGQAASMDVDLMTDGSGFKSIIIPSGAYRNRKGDVERTVWGDGNIRSDYDGYINGPDVFSFSIREAPRIIKRFLESHQGKPEHFDALVLHQANLLILKQIAKKSGFPLDRVPMSLDRFGNTSSASIPLTICDSFAGRGPMSLELLACGYGVGLSWGVMNLRVDSTALLPIIHTDETYSDGGVPHD